MTTFYDTEKGEGTPEPGAGAPEQRLPERAQGHAHGPGKGWLIPTITAYLNALGTYTGDGVGADVVSSELATGTAVERQTLSTNDFWLVTRTNDGLGPVYDQSLITALWGLNGLTAADFE